MDTSAISQRVADFLKKHPPFQGVDETDLLELAARGRVRFYEPNEYILWQGEPFRMQVFVIQQGTVTLWDEAADPPALRDVRGAGDMLGIEQFNDVDACLHSARTSTDVVIYSFPAIDFEALILKYPVAQHYIAAHSRVSSGDSESGDRGPHAIHFQELLVQARPPTCGEHDSLRHAATLMHAAGAEAIAVVDANGRIRGIVTRTRLLEWLAEGNGTADQPMAPLVHAVSVVSSQASVADVAIAMAMSEPGVAAVTDDGTPEGELRSIATSGDLARVFGDEPSSLLRSCRRSTSTQELADVNRRARALVLRHLTSAGAVDWLARFTHITDAAILTRLLTTAAPGLEASWCFCGSSGRGESLTRSTPHPIVILADDRDRARALDAYSSVIEALVACDYLPRLELSFDTAFCVAGVDEWRSRFTGWMRDPIRQEMYRARALFDLRHVYGTASLWQDLCVTVDALATRDVVHVLANDCLASLPPLTFFEDAVIDPSGEQAAVFRLEESVLRPLVDVGRVFGMAARRTLGSSTRERLLVACELLPAHEPVLREAIDTLGIVLRQQARVGLTQGTSGAELHPSLLSRSERHVLKSGFRPILHLLQLTADPAWLEVV